jgi:SepF-like predicted cell division protein (DUF552 family)
MNNLSSKSEPTGECTGESGGQTTTDVEELEERHAEEMNQLKVEFMNIAQKACDDLQELQDEISNQNIIIHNLESKVELQNNTILQLESALTLPPPTSTLNLPPSTMRSRFL